MDLDGSFAHRAASSRRMNFELGSSNFMYTCAVCTIKDVLNDSLADQNDGTSNLGL